MGANRISMVFSTPACETSPLPAEAPHAELVPEVRPPDTRAGSHYPYATSRRLGRQVYAREPSERHIKYLTSAKMNAQAVTIHARPSSQRVVHAVIVFLLEPHAIAP